jgi:branched-chain amino acid transport system ATP-binding protein
MPSLSVRDLVPAGSRIRCSFEVAEGELVALEAASAAETSSVLQAIAGHVPAKGSAQIDGRELLGREPDARAALGLGYVAQGHRIFMSLRVGEHVRLAQRLRGERPLSRADLEGAIPLLAARREQFARTLSGGETQLLLLAEALAGNPSVLVLDQPFEGLDPEALALFGGMLEARRAAGVAILLADARTAAVRALAPSRTIVIR